MQPVRKRQPVGQGNHRSHQRQWRFRARPDSLVIFTKHEEEGAFAVEMVLRNMAPVDPFVVQWQFPLFVREQSLDPSPLKQVGGRPAKHTPENLLECLENNRLRSKSTRKTHRPGGRNSVGRTFGSAIPDVAYFHEVGRRGGRAVFVQSLGHYPLFPETLPRPSDGRGCPEGG